MGIFFTFAEMQLASLVTELDESLQLDCPTDILPDSEESIWAKRTEKQEEKWSLLRPKLFEETLAYSGCADPNVSEGNCLCNLYIIFIGLLHMWI